jgi:hypothetical protein
MSLIGPKPEELVRKDHPCRKLLSIIDFCEFCKPLENLYSKDFRRPGISKVAATTAKVSDDKGLKQILYIFARKLVQ